MPSNCSVLINLHLNSNYSGLLRHSHKQCEDHLAYRIDSLSVIDQVNVIRKKGGPNEDAEMCACADHGIDTFAEVT